MYMYIYIYTYASDIYLVWKWFKRNTNTFDNQKRTLKSITKRLLGCERAFLSRHQLDF
jgi:hypothetical protein